MWLGNDVICFTVKWACILYIYASCWLSDYISLLASFAYRSLLVHLYIVYTKKYKTMK